MMENLPTQLCRNNQKSTLLPRVTTHAYAGCKISAQHPTKLHNKFPRIDEVGHSQITMLTCFGTNKCSWSRGHLCFKCSSLLACKGAACNSFSNWCFPSPSYTLQLGSISVLFEQWGTSHSSKLGSLKNIKRHSCSVGTWKYLTWCQ